MKFLLISILLTVSATSSAYYENSCIWDGEEYLKKPVLEDHIMWTRLVYDLHQEGDFVTGHFSGLGSCRFFDRSMGVNFDSALKKVEETGYQTAVRAHFVFSPGQSNSMILPSAYKEAGTGIIIIKKDFYNSVDYKVCKQQQADLVDLSKVSPGIAFSDISVKRNVYGGFSAVVNRKKSSKGMYGVCHFH